MLYIFNFRLNKMKANASVKVEHIALCANKSPKCLDIGPSNIVSFGSSNSVVIYQPLEWNKENCQNIYTFNKHDGKVLCTKWLRTQKDTAGIMKKLNYLLTSGTDKKIIFWEFERTNCNKTFCLKPLATLQEHKESVTSLDSLLVETNSNAFYLLVSTAADSTMKVWINKGTFNSFKCLQTIDFKNGFVLDVVLHKLPLCDTLILACACDDFFVRLYTFQNLHKSDVPMQFELALTLKGHEDWVRGVDFIFADTGLLYLASCSQDSFIRIWKICEDSEIKSDDTKLQVQNQYFFACDSKLINHKFTVTIDAVLSGHENWVYSAHWNKNEHNDELSLLTASIDKTVIVWNYDQDEKVWVDKVRVGELGGNTLGFYGAHLSSNGKHIIAHSYSGALHGWDIDCNGKWSPAVFVSGHSSAVNDISWEPKLGRYLLSVGDDQTTRLYSQCKSDSWHEIARPQIHGYDMQCFAMLNSFQFVSGADEKVLRVFQASKNFTENLKSLTNHHIEENLDLAPEGATVPALGLSNKAVFVKKQEPVIPDRREQYIENLFSPVHLQKPPPETYLLQNTLWPETRKIYGHVYEIFCVACNSSGNLVASAAKSSQLKHSSIMIWNASSWEQVNNLTVHNLTVTQMEFSPNDDYLLSVSRDRTWVLHEIKNEDQHFSFCKVAQSDKKIGHSRIIWSCSWSHDNTMFATGSRDKKVLVWKLIPDEDSYVTRVSLVDCNEPVTAVAFAKAHLMQDKYAIAVGHESGKIKISIISSDYAVVNLLCFDQNLSHCAAVKRLQWNAPNDDVASDSGACLASCGLDHQVKIFKVHFD